MLMAAVAGVALAQSPKRLMQHPALEDDAGCRIVHENGKSRCCDEKGAGRLRSGCNATHRLPGT